MLRKWMEGGVATLSRNRINFLEVEWNSVIKFFLHYSQYNKPIYFHRWQYCLLESATVLLKIYKDKAISTIDSNMKFMDG